MLDFNQITIDPGKLLNSVRAHGFKQFGHIVRSLKNCGQATPLVLTMDNELKDGFFRAAAFQFLGWNNKKVLVIYEDDSAQLLQQRLKKIFADSPDVLEDFAFEIIVDDVFRYLGIVLSDGSVGIHDASISSSNPVFQSLALKLRGALASWRRRYLPKVKKTSLDC